MEEFYPVDNPENEEPLAIPVSGKTLKGKLGAKVEALQEAGSK